MANKEPFIHPYMPNSVPEIKNALLRELGVEDAEELFEQIPESIRFRGDLNLPETIKDPVRLQKHLTSILFKNKTCEENLNFLGAGCWQHYVPAVCNEVVQRTEFVASIDGSGSPGDHGKHQAWFEYCSQLGELLKMDMVGMPLYSWGSAAGFALRMATRMTGRKKVLLPKIICPERLDVIKGLCGPNSMPNCIQIEYVGYDQATGILDLDDLREKITENIAAVYIENPSYLGIIESQGAQISEIAHSSGAEFIVGVDPISLGVLLAPSDYGADIVVGTSQPLGIHMNCGGGSIGFIASRDEIKYVSQYPTIMFSITTTTENEFGFASSSAQQTTYGAREKANDFIGCSTHNWAIASAVYMALMGTQGFREIGELIIKRSHYAMKLLSEINGVKVILSPNSFKEFVVNFDNTGKKVKDINKALLEYNIFGGKDITNEFPELGNNALYCVTEIHSKEDIEKLAFALKEVLAK